jgi:lipopolysaccharide export system protein LptC
MIGDRAVARARVSGAAEGGAVAPAARTRAIAAARRHSRLVWFFKRAIPLGAVAGVLGVGSFAFFNPFRHVEGVTVGPVSVSGTQVTMELPKLTGFKDDSRPYEVTASAAHQDVRQPNLVELKDLRARIVTDDQGNSARLEASSGVLDTQKERMELRQSVRVRTDSGQDVQLRSAQVDFKAGTVVSDEPVTVSLANGLIQAQGLEVKDGGKVLHFRGRVSTMFESVPDGQDPAPTGSTRQPFAEAPSTILRP